MEHSSREHIITGNWKMYKTVEEAAEFVKGLMPVIESIPFKVFLAVPFTAIQPLVIEKGNSPLVIGAQNMNDAEQGAFTGEIAARMLLDVGAQFVLLGHSERRHFYHEDNAFINRKIKRAIQDGLRPVLCVGETEDEHEADQARQVIETQLKECLDGIDPESLEHLIVAYEPIWAIGSGNSATPEMAQDMHHFCRECLSQILTPDIAEKIVIQYGGSVNASNAQALLDQPDIDGLLIGGASLSLESFTQIVNDRLIKLNQD